MIFSGSMLDSMVCPALLRDSMKQRHGIEGPMRQGQALHRLAEVYLGHLHKTRRRSDVAEGRAIWDSIRPQLSAEDEAGAAGAAESILADEYDWVVGAERFELEVQRYFDASTGAEVEAERAASPGLTVFRTTADAAWYGYGPRPVAGMAGKAWHVLDQKSGRIIEHVTAPADHRQLLRYASCVVPKEAEFAVLWLWHSRHGIYEHAIVTRGQLDDAWRTHVAGGTGNALRILESAGEERVVGGHCAGCKMIAACDAAQRYPHEALAAKVSGGELVDAVKVSEEVRKRLLLALKTAAEGEGPLPKSATFEAKVKDVTTVSIPSSAIRAVLQDMPDDVLDGIMRTGKTALKRSLRGLSMKKGDVDDAMEAISKHPDTESRTSTRLTIERIKHARADETFDAGDLDDDPIDP